MRGFPGSRNRCFIVMVISCLVMREPLLEFQRRYKTRIIGSVYDWLFMLIATYWIILAGTFCWQKPPHAMAGTSCLENCRNISSNKREKPDVLAWKPPSPERYSVNHAPSSLGLPKDFASPRICLISSLMIQNRQMLLNSNAS